MKLEFKEKINGNLQAITDKGSRLIVYKKQDDFESIFKWVFILPTTKFGTDETKYWSEDYFDKSKDALDDLLYYLEGKFETSIEYEIGR